MKSNADVTFWRELKASRPMLTKQHTEHPKVRRADAISAGHRQYHTIKGQAIKGNVMAARKGLQRIQQRRQHR